MPGACLHPFIRDKTAKTAVTQLKKRLQKGKEIRRTLQALGTDVLSLSPDISV